MLVKGIPWGFFYWRKLSKLAFILGHGLIIISIKGWDVSTYTCSNFNGGLANSHVKVGNGWIITPHGKHGWNPRLNLIQYLSIKGVLIFFAGRDSLNHHWSRSKHWSVQWGLLSRGYLIHCDLLTPRGDIDQVNIASGNGLVPDDTKPLP